MILRSNLLLCLLSLCISKCVAEDSGEDKPNLIMIMTDEHHFKTLGCYRDLMEEKHAFPWGKGVKVETPNIDRLANEGAIFKNYYTVTPLCTPSRASFMSGKYPTKTGESYQNHGAMDESIVTFAQYLRKKKDYYTGYFGKWHLDGKPKPGIGVESKSSARKFGFVENRFRVNRGHWKFFDIVDWNVEVFEYNKKSEEMFEGRMEENYSTDFLFDRGIDFIKRQKRKENHFAMVLSISDPHAPNDVRPPYDKMFKDMYFQLPETAVMAAKGEPSIPFWTMVGNAIKEGNADEVLKEKETDDFYQRYMMEYFGMVKLLDDNVGKLLGFLDQENLTNNTIIVFTSDHGDQLFEHGKMNKGTAYEGSLKIPHIVRYPNKIPAGKVIEEPFTSIDFTPTILGMMGVEVNDAEQKFDGIDASSFLLDDEADRSLLGDNHIRFAFDVAKQGKGRWAAAIMNDMKLVLSKQEVPWLFDLKRDPDEVINFYNDPEYQNVTSLLKSALLVEVNDKNIPNSFFDDSKLVQWDTPTCRDTPDAIQNYKWGFCSQISTEGVSRKYSNKRCDWKFVKEACPLTCNQCCEDSEGFMMKRSELMSCASLVKKGMCNQKKVQEFCPKSCGMCQDRSIVE